MSDKWTGGVTASDDAEEPEESDVSDSEDEEATTIQVDSAGSEAGGVELAAEAEEVSDGVSITEEEGMAENVPEPPQNPSEPDTAGQVPIPSSAMSVDEAADLERRWKIMVWGPPGLFKSHFCYTAPSPIAYLDLEGKADDIAAKFDGKRIALWQPTDYYEAKEALDDALKWLEAVDKEEDVRGTIVVDSMSELWEWAQYAYVKEAYPTDDPEEKLKDVFQEFNLDDWKWIKNKHNAEFRKRLTDSPFHFVWTAGQKTDIESDYGSKLKADGEKNNKHKADTIIRARKNDEGVKVGDMVKSNFTDRLFRGLERPTFGKVVDTVTTIEKAEANPGEYTLSELEDKTGVEIVRYDPMFESEDDD